MVKIAIIYYGGTEKDFMTDLASLSAAAEIYES